MTNRARGRVRNAALLILLAMASCKSDCSPTKHTAPGSDPVPLTGSGAHYVEISAAAAAPVGNGVCKDGIILVASGGSNKQLLMGSVQTPFPSSFNLAEWDGLNKKWAKLGSGPIQPPQTLETEAPFGWDNQTARLANGDLLLMWNGKTTSALTDISELPWWDTPAGRNGFRPAQVFWRYSCLTGQWSSTPGLLDSGTASVLDENGTPRPRGYCAELRPGFGGFDRPELYVDPFTVDPNDASKQRIYVSTDCKRTADRHVQIFASPDSGQSWEPSGITLDPGTPVAMTSTFNGRLLLFQHLGETPTLYYSDDKGKSLAISMADDGSGEEKPSDRFDITFEYPEPLPGKPDPHAGEQKKFVVGALQSDVTGVGPPGVPTLSLARTGLNAAMAVYPAIENVTVNGKQIERQVAAVVWVLTRDKDHGPIVVPIKIIRAQAPGGSVLMATFIEDDSPSQKVGTSLLYWLETVSPPASPTEPIKMLARYLVFTGIIPTKEEGLLSDAAGWEINNRKPQHALGDYMKGAFYSHGGALNFVAVWPQVPPTVASKDRSQVYMRLISFVPEGGVEQPSPEKMFGARPALRASLRQPTRPISLIPHDLKTRELEQIGKP